MVSEEIKDRKGARKVQDIPENVLQLLNKGKIPTVNLTEWLAVNQADLIKNTFQKMGLNTCVDTIIRSIEQQKKSSTMSTMKLIGEGVYAYCRQAKTLAATIQFFSKHESDTIRCYATYLIALNTDLSISEKLQQSRTLIADHHFGVREIAWMALRPEIEKNLMKSIKILSEWTTDSNENIRRFTTEATRPRGVWCKHILALKDAPEQALPILTPLKSDASTYVQNSVGNWLNDASKSKPEFVIQLCKKWKLESPTTATEKIIKRALRTVVK